MVQKLSIAFAQVKAGCASENLFNEIKYIIYSLYRAKEITQKAKNKKMNSVKVQYKKWILHVRILKIVKHLILTDYYSILQIK